MYINFKSNKAFNKKHLPYIRFTFLVILTIGAAFYLVDNIKLESKETAPILVESGISNNLSGNDVALEITNNTKEDLQVEVNYPNNGYRLLYIPSSESYYINITPGKSRLRVFSETSRKYVIKEVYYQEGQFYTWNIN